ncbi:hypothetical protein [Nonomuraea sp. NPDC050202]|jgi:uncharacterized membrane protein YoaK (UPF0700 family)|uniref:hypothetical protein n=1 Tax=Nonomuraea sp. NPDC050202 TaxID=3155035 RepID=UPI0033C04DCB
MTAVYPPPEPDRPRISRNALVVVLSIAAGAVCLAAATISMKAFSIAMCAVILVAMICSYRLNNRE